MKNSYFAPKQHFCLTQQTQVLIFGVLHDTNCRVC